MRHISSTRLQDLAKWLDNFFTTEVVFRIKILLCENGTIKKKEVVDLTPPCYLKIREMVLFHIFIITDHSHSM